jgi:hypothetical protein
MSKVKLCSYAIQLIIQSKRADEIIQSGAKQTYIGINANHCK